MARISRSTATSASGNGHVTAPCNAAIDTPTVVPAADYSFDFDSPRYAALTKPVQMDPSLGPDGSRSMSSIGLQAFSLGFVFALCLLSTTWLLLNDKTIWRLPAFFACLSIFHFLEFWTTARFNVPAVRASSFLLFNNGTAYNVAHALATCEIIVSNIFPTYGSGLVNRHTIATGFGLVVTGQLVRSIAMAQAGTNFNHTPQRTRQEGHELVTRGIYSWLRHPSYFGFFWWALGTQVLVGNKVCVVGYLVALWTFFYKRIIGKPRPVH